MIKKTILNSDCLVWMKSQLSESIDCIITSPPYNKKGLREGARTSENVWGGANIDYNNFGDNMPESEYHKWQQDIVSECLRLLKPTGSLFYQHKIRNWARRGHHPMLWLKPFHSNFYQEIVWHRRSTTAIDKRYLFNTTERIYWFVKDKPNVYKEQLNEKYKSDVWQITPTHNQNHPATFPEQLVENCILMTTKPGDIVLDPFSGVGTTCRVAEKLNRHSIGIEIDNKYCIEASKVNQFNSLFEEKINGN